MNSEAVARKCGECSLCCRLLPVNELDKLANERCRHQRRTGCRVYDTTAMPLPCKLWNCRWLVNDDAGDLPRPDRAHYVIDMLPDFVVIQNNDDGTEQRVEAVQVWTDPRHPDAHRDPALRAYLERRGLEGKIALVRFGSKDAIVLIPPSMNSTGQFVEATSNLFMVPEHTKREIVEALAEQPQ